MDCRIIFNGYMKVPKQQLDIIDLIRQGSEQLGISLPEHAPAAMFRHMELLQQWGSKVNLTSLRDPLDIIVIHFLDSLTVFKVLAPPAEMSVLDVGTGAGFPGMVLKVVDESLEVSLLDRDPRKIVFLKHVAHQLSLKGLSFFNMPLKSLIHSTNPHSFDVVVSRALKIDEFFMDSLNVLLHPGGSVITMSGPSSDHQGFVLKNFSLENQWEGHLPFLGIFRRVSRYSWKSPIS